MRTLVLSALFVSACAPSDVEPTPIDDPDPEPPTCDIVVDATLPFDGSDDAYYRGGVEFWLSDHDPSAAVLSPVPGETQLLGNIVLFTPNEPLEPDSYYEFGLDYCHGEPTIGFWTSRLGLPLDMAAEELVGNTYSVDLLGGRYLEGDNAADLAVLLFGETMLLQVTHADADRLAFRVAWQDGELTQSCPTTVDLRDGHFDEAPFFALARDVINFDVDGYEFPLHDVWVDGTYDEAGDEIGHLRFGLLVDARDISAAWGLGDAHQLCELAETMHAPCGPCPDDAFASCIHITADQLVGELDKVGALPPPDVHCVR